MVASSLITVPPGLGSLAVSCASVSSTLATAGYGLCPRLASGQRRGSLTQQACRQFAPSRTRSRTRRGRGTSDDDDDYFEDDGSMGSGGGWDGPGSGGFGGFGGYNGGYNDQPDPYAAGFAFESQWLWNCVQLFTFVQAMYFLLGSQCRQTPAPSVSSSVAA